MTDPFQLIKSLNIFSSKDIKGEKIVQHLIVTVHRRPSHHGSQDLLRLQSAIAMLDRVLSSLRKRNDQGTAFNGKK